MLRKFSKGLGGLLRFNTTVSCERAAFGLAFALFFKVCLRMLELLWFFRKELDILRRRFIGTNINKFNNTVCMDLGGFTLACLTSTLNLPKNFKNFFNKVIAICFMLCYNERNVDFKNLRILSLEVTLNEKRYTSKI